VPNKRVRGFVQLFGTNVITKLAWALTLLLLLRTLGVQSFGFLATLWSSATIAAGLVDLGTGQVALREGSRHPASSRPLATSALALQLLLTLLLTAVLALGGWMLLPADILPPWQRACVIVLAVATPLIDRLQALFTVCSQLGGSYTSYTRLRSSYFATVLIVLAAVLALHGDLLAVSIAYFVLTVIFAAAMAAGTWRLLPARGNMPEAGRLAKLILQGLPFLGVMTLTLAYGRVEVSILGAWGQTAAAGAYHIAYQVVLLVYSVAGMFFTITYPRLYGHRGDRAALAADFRDSVRWLSLLGWLAAPLLLLYAEPMMHLVGGDALAHFAPMLRVLAVLVLLTPASVALNFLLPLDRLHWRIGCDAIGVAITAAGAAYAAATAHPMWAAVAEVCGYACAMVCAHFVARRALPAAGRTLVEELGGIGWRVVPAILIAWLVPFTWWLGCLIFVAVSVLLLLVTRHPVCDRLLSWLSHLRS
jgi:O-antigen/teichoic acid export membrane protein